MGRKGGPEPKVQEQNVRKARDLWDQGVKLPCFQKIKLSRWVVMCFFSGSVGLCTGLKKPAPTFKAPWRGCWSASRTGQTCDLQSCHPIGISSHVFLSALEEIYNPGLCWPPCIFWHLLPLLSGSWTCRLYRLVPSVPGRPATVIRDDGEVKTKIWS